MEIMEIIEKIKEVQDYFRGKLLAGEFEVTRRSEHTWTIIIDDYEFCIWVSNDAIYRRLHPGEYNFIDIPMSATQCIALDKIMLPMIITYRTGDLIAVKRKQLEQLKKELGEI